MGALAWAYVVVGTLFAGALLLLLKCKYDDVQDDFARDLGWHLMWHERVYDPEDESGPGDAPTVADGDAS